MKPLEGTIISHRHRRCPLGAVGSNHSRLRAFRVRSGKAASGHPPHHRSHIIFSSKCRWMSDRQSAIFRSVPPVHGDRLHFCAGFRLIRSENLFGCNHKIWCFSPVNPQIFQSIQNFAPHTAPVKARFYEMSAALHSPTNTRAGTEAVKMAERIEFENSLKRRKEDVRDEKKGLVFPVGG